jgi:N-ethylmaleimide reductase
MLFDPFSSDALQLKNHIVMAPLTRSRAVEQNTPNDLMAEYYVQRAGAGLIITEGTSPSPNGLGYPRIPGLFNAAQVAGWRKVTETVHAKGGHHALGRDVHGPGRPAAAPAAARNDAGGCRSRSR